MKRNAHTSNRSHLNGDVAYLPLRDVTVTHLPAAHAIFVQFNSILLSVRALDTTLLKIKRKIQS